MKFLNNTIFTYGSVRRYEVYGDDIADEDLPNKYIDEQFFYGRSLTLTYAWVG